MHSHASSAALPVAPSAIPFDPDSSGLTCLGLEWARDEGCAGAYASERKILLVSDVIAIVKAKHVELSKQGSAAAFD